MNNYERVLAENNVEAVGEVYGGSCRGCFVVQTNPRTSVCPYSVGEMCSDADTIFIPNTDEGRARYMLQRTRAALGLEEKNI